MKRLALWSFVPVVVLLLLSCPSALRNPYEGLESKVFWAQNLTSGEQYGAYYEVDAVLLATGDKCLVWAERSAGVSVDAGKAVAWEYDHRIYDKIVTAFGSPAIMESGDVDENRKLILLLLDIKDGFQGSGAYTAGYFNSADLLLSNNSNKSDMIYVDTYPSTLRSPDSYATIAHELQHFINYTARLLDGRRRLETWVDEGLSAAAEYIYLEEHNKTRIAHFTLSETAQGGNNFFVWERTNSSRLLDDYSTVYLFFQWLRVQSGGTEIYKNIIASPYSDYRAVTGAISGAFAAELGSPDWAAALRSWLAANYINSQDGLYGYHGEIPQLKVYALGGAEQQLLPGEGVYSKAGDPPGAFPSDGGPNIRYAGLRKAAGSPPQEPGVNLDALDPQGMLLTFNSNEQENGRREKGPLTGEEGETIPQFLSAGRSAGPGSGNSGSSENSQNSQSSWIIDARDILGREDR
jgi:hypothetical protein